MEPDVVSTGTTKKFLFRLLETYFEPKSFRSIYRVPAEARKVLKIFDVEFPFFISMSVCTETWLHFEMFLTVNFVSVVLRIIAATSLT